MYNDWTNNLLRNYWFCVLTMHRSPKVSPFVIHFSYTYTNYRPRQVQLVKCQKCSLIPSSFSPNATHFTPCSRTALIINLFNFSHHKSPLIKSSLERWHGLCNKQSALMFCIVIHGAKQPTCGKE